MGKNENFSCRVITNGFIYVKLIITFVVTQKISKDAKKDHVFRFVCYATGFCWMSTGEEAARRRPYPRRDKSGAV
ncbi:hypothetical protein GCM10017764_34380 [Sphingobacterium griseoflavum]|uniref:Uncharacterized protein n=1 Tax=Sphingobacterium griseoflavum TaxID=1474952 RepID=A0ABQ3HYS2_9SPHI|nr:hypothetical protein GCM10017764_34380 [Sphingobacterium griseoflavum]